MTHKGCKQTVVTALPTLLRLARTPGKYRPLLGCHGTKHPVPDSAHDIDLLDWSYCPLCLLADPHFGAIFALDKLAKVAPLQGWPDRYAAWAVAGLMAVREAREGG